MIITNIKTNHDDNNDNDNTDENNSNCNNNKIVITTTTTLMKDAVLDFLAIFSLDCKLYPAHGIVAKVQSSKSLGISHVQHVLC